MNNSNPNQSLYPATIAVKVIIANDELIEQEINQIILGIFPNFDLKLVKKQISANLNFLSLTYPIHTESKEPIEMLYQKLHSHPKIKMVL